MGSYAEEWSAVTDMIFIALRYELTKFAGDRIAIFRLQGKNPSQFHLVASGDDKTHIDDAFREVEEILESKYLRYCDPSQPPHLMTMLIARFSLSIIRFLSHHPRRWVSSEQIPQAERQFVWDVCTKPLGQQNMHLSNPLLNRFAWHEPYFQQWGAFIHMLDTLRADPLHSEADEACQLIGKVYASTLSMVLDTRRPIHVAVGNLCLEAYGDSESATLNANMRLLPAPNFMSQLRQ